MARTVTTGGAISGYCAIGSTRIAARPAITMKIESTAAKIGRSMKKREIMRASHFFSAGAAGFCGALSRRLAAGLARRLCRAALAVAAARGIADLHRPTCTGAPGPIFITPSTTTRSPGLQAGLSMIQPSPAQSPTSHRPRLGLALGVDDVDELALRAFEHRALRHHDRARPHRALQHDAHELAGAQHAAGIGEFGARLARAGLGVDPHVGEVERAARARRSLPSASLTLALKRPSAGSLSRPASTSRRSARCSRSGMPKITYIGSICVTVVSSTLGPDTSVPSETAARLATPRDRRFDPRVVEVELRFVHARLGALHFGFGDLLGGIASSSSFWLTAFASSTASAARRRASPARAAPRRRRDRLRRGRARPGTAPGRW